MLLINKRVNILSANNYDAQTSYLKLKLTHRDVNKFLKAPVNGSVDLSDLNHIDLSGQEALADKQPEIMASLELLKNKLIYEWNKIMKISKINVIPIAVNRFYEMTNYRKLGDILYSNVSNQGTLNVYVIYDWLKTMNSGFMLAPYSVAANNLLLDLPPKQLNSNEYYNWKLSTDRTPVFMEQISIVNKTGDYDIDFSGHSPTKVNDYHINLNFVLNKRIVLDAIVSSNNSIVAIIWVIGALSFIMALVKIIVTLNIILRSNINTINLLKAIWYNKRWIAMRIFIIYLPLIIVAGLLSLPFGYLISYFGYLQLIKISYMFVAYSIIFPQIIYITLVILAILIIALFIMSYIKARRFPVYRFVS